MNRTKIEWTDYTWNPVTGCTKVSQGCKNCYAEVITRRFPEAMGNFKEVKLHPERLEQPAKVKKGAKIFVCDVSDLFHPDVPFEFIEKVFCVMLFCPQHTFQILTKRIDRALQFYNEVNKRGVLRWIGRGAIVLKTADDGWPLSNVCIGTSCEDQETANERIPFLLQIPASVRFLSCEPLLGPVDLDRYLPIMEPSSGVNIHWVIAGGESGHRARPMHPDWVRSLRDQCSDSGVPFFFKQWGEYMPFERDPQPPFYRCAATREIYDGHGMNHIDPETCEAGRWMGGRWYDPMDAISLCMETKSADCTWLKLGKHKTGNKLDGKQHLEFPILKQ